MMMMKTMIVAGLLVLVSPIAAQDAAREAQPGGAPAESKAPSPKPAEPKLNQAELEKQFEKTMTGATMIGRFTVEGRGDAGRVPKEERYEISKVTKMPGDYWLFAARVQYGSKDVTVPMMLQVKWAGDTPVITLTDLAIPGLGTYTARVMIFRDHYAGYWSGGDHGGNLWGRIERNGQAAPKPPEAPDAPDAPSPPAPSR